MTDLKKVLGESGWAALLTAGLEGIAREAAQLRKGDARPLAASVYAVLTALEALLPEHIASVEGLVKLAEISRRNDELMQKNAGEIERLKQEIAELDRGRPLPIVRPGGWPDKHSGPGLEPAEIDALYKVAEKVSDPADRRVVKNAADLLAIRKALSAKP